MTKSELTHMELSPDQQKKFIRQILARQNLSKGKMRYCLWIEDADLEEAMTIEPDRKRIDGVRKMRLASRDKGANEMARRSHQMREMNIGKKHHDYCAWRFFRKSPLFTCWAFTKRYVV